MAKSKKKAKLSRFSRFSKQQLVVMAVFILSFGGFGIWKLAFSNAATIEQIAFRCNTGICSSNVDGSAKKTIINNNAYDPAWSYDGSKIAYSLVTGTDKQAIYVANADGTNQHLVSASFTENIATNPVWSRDGTKISFVANLGKIITIDVNSGNITRTLNINALRDQQISFSPDETKIAYAKLETTGYASIYVANSDGSGSIKISKGTIDKYSSTSPSWSPDGTKIAYHYQDQNLTTTDIYITNPTGTIQTPLNQTAVVKYARGNITWSPDSTRIAFMGSDINNQNFISVINISGANISTISEANPGVLDPTWGIVPAVPADTQQPVANITNPANGLKIKGTKPIAISYSASDNIGVVKLELYIDNVLINTLSNTSSGQYSWDIKNIARGTHTISVKAYDAANNVGVKSISVTK